ncbi:MAG: alcohol dehydrogenase catalytic domain-containing protein [Chloroflexi bacterium]|nr:alcohol dehydrogenase catalytic domain-containing protein [Chloroflexota bacterium]
MRRWPCAARAQRARKLPPDRNGARGRARRTGAKGTQHVTEGSRQTMETEGVIFLRPGEVELETVEVGEPSEGQVRVATEVTLISTGTELTALSGEFPPGSVWSRYVQYPFRPGYSHVGVVEQVGPGVSGLSEGDRVYSGARHAGAVLLPASAVRRLPAA